MTGAMTKITEQRRTSILTIVVTMLYFLTLGLVLYELDRQHFTGEKERIIREHFREIFALPDTLGELAGDVLFAPSEAVRQRAAERLRKEMEAIVRGPSSIFSFRLEDANRNVVMGLQVTDPEKPKRLNTWRNSLFLRNFERITDLGVKRERGAASAGRLVARYTTPTNYPPIEQLTRLYWGIVGVLVVVWLVVYYFLYRYVLRAMHTVTTHLQESKEGTPRLILRPYGGLETAYNEMAMRALLQRLNEILGRLLQADEQREEGGQRRVLEDTLTVMLQAFGLERVELALVANDGASWSLIEQVGIPDVSSPRQDAAVLRDGEHPKKGFTADSKTGDFIYWAPVEGMQLVIRGRLQASVPAVGLRFQGVEQSCEVIQQGIHAWQMFQQSLTRQRSEANISLSRNLGHDLTNILATTKLELQTMKELVKIPSSEFTQVHQQLLRESVEGVLRSAELLQNIVDIYRSFSHVKQPRYERHDLNELVESFLKTFKPTVSGAVQLEQDFGQEIPPPIVEPRLLKLALFNVLSNAMDAIRRAQTGENPSSPRVCIRTGYNPEKAYYEIVVEDSGAGIRDPQGRLLENTECNRIFEYGYSTKSERSEGLGLHWVKTIIEQFHHGSVRAENRPEGGARIVLRFRSMETEEAKIGAENSQHA